MIIYDDDDDDDDDNDNDNIDKLIMINER